MPTNKEASQRLIDAREKANMTQRDLAKNLSISQAKVSRYESDPGAMPANLLVRWCTTLGVGMEQLLAQDQYAELEVNPGQPYADFHQSLEGAAYYIENQAPDWLPEICESDNGQDVVLPSKDDLLAEIQRLSQKPNVMMAGGFDTGKSFIANTLMGQEVLPVSYQPATKLVIVVRHIDDRPSAHNEEVYFLKESIWTDKVIDVAALDNREAIDGNLVQSGPTELLQKYAAHSRDADEAGRDGSPEGSQVAEIHTAVVYLDAPILRACNIIDIPGFADQLDSEDEEKAVSALPYAHVVLYASRIKGHLSANDHIRISEILRQLVAPEAEADDFPALGNFFIIGSQADRSVSDEDVAAIQQKGIRRLYTYLESAAIEKRRKSQLGGQLSEEALLRQWFPFWAENVNRSRPLVEQLESILGELYPQVHTTQASAELIEVRKQAEQRSSNAAAEYSLIAQDTDASIRKLEAHEKATSQLLDELENNKESDKILSLIEELKNDSRDSIKGKIDYRLGERYIKKLIERNFESKSEAKKNAHILVLEEIQSSVEEVLEEKSEVLTKEVDKYLGRIEQRFEYEDNDGTRVKIPFDVGASFAGGIAGAGALGALAFWAAQMGPLGGYILVAKGVGALAAMGFATSGTAATIAAVSAMGGPIVLGLGVGAIVGLTTWRLLSKSWEGRLARKIRSHFKEKEAKKKILARVDAYWEDTTTAFKKGVDSIKSDLKAHQKKLKDSRENKQEAQRLADLYQEAHTYYKAIPLPESKALAVNQR